MSESSSKTEIKLQWIAIGCMALSLILSLYSHSSSLRASRIESEINSYLHLNDRYHNLLFTLIENDSEIFKKTDQEALKKKQIFNLRTL